jgi:hypothetical protein
MSIVIVNKEVFQSRKITIDCGKAINGADLIELRSTALSATTGQTLQGGTVENDGAIMFGAHYKPASISCSWVTCHVPAISAVLLLSLLRLEMSQIYPHVTPSDVGLPGQSGV